MKQRKFTSGDGDGRVTVEEFIIPARNVILYLTLKERGYRTVWCGEGKVCLEKRTKQDSGRTAETAEVTQ